MQNHPILKKKKENSSPLNFIKCFCAKLGFSNDLLHGTTTNEVKEEVLTAMREQKDFDFVKDKKVIEIRTINNEIRQMSLIDFLLCMSETKNS